MAIVGSNLESKEIGLSIGLSGTHYNTEIDAVTGYLKLKNIDIDANGNPLYADEGYWISDVINLGDIFGDFDKVFATEVINGASSLAVQTRVSDDGNDWSNWTPVAMDGTIQSDTKQYVQVKINLYAGFVHDVFTINKREYEQDSTYIENIVVLEEDYIIPSLTSNNATELGTPFANSTVNNAYPIYYAFDNKDNTLWASATGTALNGYIGFKFNSPIKIKGYKIGSPNLSGFTGYLPRGWELQASNNTTTGADGTWVVLDTQTKTWSNFETLEIPLELKDRYIAYRIKNTVSQSQIGVGQLNFLVGEEAQMRLKREYEYDMALDSTWTEEGSLHRQKITRDEWLRIDKMNVLRVVK